MQRHHVPGFKPFDQSPKDAQKFHNHSQTNPESSPNHPLIDLQTKQKIKHDKIQSQIKKIGFHVNPKSTDKNLFFKDLSTIIGNFFNPFINEIAHNQRILCQKLGYPVDQPKDDKNKNTSDPTFQESKFQTSIPSKKTQTQKSTQGKSRIKKSSEELQPEKNGNNNEPDQHKRSLKRRIIRKIIKKPQNVSMKRSNEERVLAKEMEKKFGVKLKNNRLYMKGMPKKPVSSFFFFFKEYSTKLHDQNQHLVTTKEITYGSALAKRISQRWKQMTEQQKKPYYEKSSVTRKLYKDSMDMFKRQNKAVFDSFKRIKRVKANQTRRIKIQRDSLNLSQNSNEEEVEIEVEENSQSSGENVTPKNSQGSQMKPIELEDHEELEIVIPDDEEEENTKVEKTNKSKNFRERFKSVHKPKSPAPSFFFYYNEKKTEISQEHGVTRGARITQIASVMWRGLSDEEKRPYEILADERRKKYYEQMKQFELQHPQEWSKMQAYKRKVATDNLRCRKKKPIETQPEQKSSVQQNSQSIQEECEDQQIDSLEGNVIQKTHTDQKKKVQVDKGSNSKRKRPLPKEKDEKSKKGSKQNLDYKEHRPKAPISSFFMFYKMNNSVLSEQFKESNGGKLVKYASEIWKNMTETQKKPYELQSEQSRQNYYNQMEAYKQKYPEELKQRKLALKRRQEKAAEQGQIVKKKKSTPSEKLESVEEGESIKKQVRIKSEEED